MSLLRVLDLRYVNLYFSVFKIFYSFCSRYLQDCRADLHQLFQEVGKWAAIENLRFWFLNTFRRWKGGSKGHFRFRPSFAKYIMAAKRIYLSKKNLFEFWPDIFSTKRWKPRKNLSRDGQYPFVNCAFGGNIKTEALHSQHCRRTMLIVVWFIDLWAQITRQSNKYNGISHSRTKRAAGQRGHWSHQQLP